MSAWEAFDEWDDYRQPRLPLDPYPRDWPIPACEVRPYFEGKMIMPESKHIHEMITDVLNLGLTVEAYQKAGDACCPPGPKCKRALAVARTKLDETRQWLRDAQTYAESGE